MKLKKTLVSVIIPVYNAGKFLPLCLETLINQSYTNLEIIIVDDKSKDNSLKIIKEFRKKSKKIQILQNKKHYGPAVCLNRVLKLCQGQFLAFMNPYDYLSLHKFKRQVSYLNANPKTVAVGSQFITIDQNNKIQSKSTLPQQHEEIYHTLLNSLPLKPETVMINRMLLPKDILHFTTNKYPMLFTEVFIKLLQYGKIANLSQSFYRQRVGIRRYTRRQGKIRQTFSLLQLLLKSRSAYDYRPSLRTSLPAMLRNA